MKKSQMLLAVTLTGLSAGSLAAPSYEFNLLDSGYQVSEAAIVVADSNKVEVEGKCGEGKCGASAMSVKTKEGKCGEGKCGAGTKKKVVMEGKCGEGKCGASAVRVKTKEGKCGEGKCGSK